jgi:hypothetical protein
MYIGTYGTQAIPESDIREPINLGSRELVTINQLVDIVEGIASVSLERRCKLNAPRGVNGRNSANTLIKLILLGTIDPLRDGLAKTYEMD